MAIFNKYYDIFDDFIDSSDTESSSQLKFLDWPKLIDKRTRNARKSKGTLPNLSKEDCLDENILVLLLGLMSKI